MKVFIVAGSSSDEKYFSKCTDILKKFNIPYFVTVASAHRSPKRVSELLENLNPSVSVIIAMAGHAAHLAGVIASKTLLPVIGVPLPSSQLSGLDSLLSTIQMPGGIPVATMAIGETGAQNAAVLAAEILALNNPELSQRLKNYRSEIAGQLEVSAKEAESRWNS